MHFAGNDIGRILVDNGSSADILVWQCFIKMRFKEQALKKSQYPLIGFGGKRIEALGKIELNVTFGKGVTQRTEPITFDVVDINYPYNAILGRNMLVKFVAVIHQSYLCMKIPSAGGVVTVYCNQEEARKCEDNAYNTNKTVHAIEASEEDTKTFVAEDMRRDNKNEGVSPVEHTKKVPLCEDVPDRMVIIGKELEEHEEARLIQFLRNNQDVFAWSSFDLRGVSREVIEHTLTFNLKAKPIKQGQRSMSEERKKAAQGRCRSC